MIHKPIQVKNLSLSFSHKICFDDFNIQIHHGARIGIIGNNGSGKSTLLKILHGSTAPTCGTVSYSNEVIFGMVPQIIESDASLSGGQRLNKALTRALSLNPNVLLLDEPTNHLDAHNRKSLMRLLQSYAGTLIIVSHDAELLRQCIDTLWHIDNGQIHVFTGNFDDYLSEIRQRRASIEQALSQLNREKKELHQALMKEQNRAAKSKAKGHKSIQQKKWPTVVSHAKASRAEETSGQKKSALDHKKQVLSEQLSNLHLPEIIVPTFSITAARTGDRILVSIQDGCIGYPGGKSVLEKISLSLNAKDRIAIQGKNASGKSTLIKGLLDDLNIIKSGSWTMPKSIDIGYLDQHYHTLSPEKTVFETLSELAPTWSHIEVRRHLNDFLFKKNEEVTSKVALLSGGEKARLTLAQIAAKTPKLLILDEITNNLDLETKGHVIEVLRNYPGAMIIISHDADFLNKIHIQDFYEIEMGTLNPVYCHPRI
jgi:ATPase subunit of ABC transporter with duplicated ATPase domains